MSRAIYNQWPPLANPSRPPGEWQTLDIAYLAARYDGDRLVRNAYLTIFMNGVMVHDNREILPTPRGGGAGRAGAPAGAGGRCRARALRRRRPRRSGRGPAIPPGAGSTDRTDGPSERDARQCRALSQHLGRAASNSGTAPRSPSQVQNPVAQEEYVHEPTTVHSDDAAARGGRRGAAPDWRVRRAAVWWAPTIACGWRSSDRAAAATRS